MSSKETKFTYDVIVIGAGIAGLAVASSLSRKCKVLLLEATDRSGGSHHPIQSSWGLRTNGLRYLPDTEDSHQALQFLSAAMQRPEMEIVSKNVPPVTEGEKDENGIPTLTSFIGFGDSTPAHYDSLSYFLSQNRIEPSLPLSQWSTLLMESFTGDFWPMSQVSKIEVEESQATGVWVNAQKFAKAPHIIFAASPAFFPPLVAGSSFHGKLKVEFSRQKFATAIQLDLLHSQRLCETDAIHCLGYLSGSEPLPSVGRFFDIPMENAGVVQYSQWLSFLNDDEAEDTDQVGEALRKMKRAIKRIYPTGLEGPLKERIGVVPSAYFTGQMKSKDGMQSMIKGVYFVHTGPNTSQNIVGALKQAEKITTFLSNSILSQEQQTQDPVVSEDQIDHSHTETDASPN